MAFYGDSAPTPREVNYYTLTSADHAAGAATQSLTGLASPHAGNRPGDGGATGDMKPPDDTGSGDGPGGAGDTAPAAGGPTTPSLGVVPSTGPPSTPPPTPTGGLPEPLQASTGGSAGTMPMGMPLGGMPLGGMPPGGAGGARGRDAPARSKSLVVPPIPHTESVTGKVSADRIAVSSTAPQDPQPPGDDQPPGSPGRIVRRITTVKPKDERQ
jgi:hypothetical protein